jgi:hypothetical protein
MFDRVILFWPVASFGPRRGPRLCFLVAKLGNKCLKDGSGHRCVALSEIVNQTLAAPMSLSAAYVGSSANIQQMDDAALSNARQQHLLRLRQSVLPLQREHLAYLKRFCEDECRLGPYYTEIVYFDRHYETKPAAYKRWSAAAKKEYDRGLQVRAKARQLPQPHPATALPPASQDTAPECHLQAADR